MAEEKGEQIVSEVEGADDPGVGLFKALTVKSFAEKIDVPLVELMTTLVKNGFMMNLNSVIEFEVASIIADELGKKVYLIESKEEEVRSEIEEIDLGVLINEKDKDNLIERAPIVSVIGHVDHGKTSLLDFIRKSNIVSKEAGAITQSIGAYQVKYNDKAITFLDTPGHEAFVAMRRRGVRATDVAILVVAADDGVKAQTLEAIHHAKEAGVPIIIAVTKIDKPDSNIMRVKEQLAERNILIEEWGGNTICCPVSSKSGEGMNNLLESILLMAEMAELKACENRPAIGTIIESNLDQKLGATASVVIHTGTLLPRDIVVIGQVHGKVRSLLDYNKKSLEKAGPSMPVLLTGLSGVPQVGDILRVVPNERLAKDMAQNLKTKRDKVKKHKDALDLELVTRKVREKSTKGINIILRADTEGSLEAIKASLARVKTKNAVIRVLRAKTGDVVGSDVSLAEISEAFVVAFNVTASSDAVMQSQESNVEIMKYDVIYKLVEDLTKKMIESLEIEYDKVDIGKAEVLKIFLSKKEFLIAGIKVKKGKVKKGSKATVIRNKEEIGTCNITKVQLINDSVQEVEAPHECGITIENFKILEHDQLEIFELVEQKIELIK
jgi:translation initiation factor IF-2